MIKIALLALVAFWVVQSIAIVIAMAWNERKSR